MAQIQPDDAHAQPEHRSEEIHVMPGWQYRFLEEAFFYAAMAIVLLSTLRYLAYQWSPSLFGWLSLIVSWIAILTISLILLRAARMANTIKWIRIEPDRLRLGRTFSSVEIPREEIKLVLLIREQGRLVVGIILQGKTMCVLPEYYVESPDSIAQKLSCWSGVPVEEYQGSMWYLSPGEWFAYKSMKCSSCGCPSSQTDRGVCLECGTMQLSKPYRYGIFLYRLKHSVRSLLALFFHDSKNKNE